MNKIKFLKKIDCLKLYKKNWLIKKIFDEICKYTDNEKTLITSLIQTPFYKTKGIKEIKRKYNDDVAENIKILNALNSRSKNIDISNEKHYEMILLYLVNCKILINHQKKIDDSKKLLSIKNVLYAQKLLSDIRIDQLRYDIEDELFKISNPEIYKNYKELLKFSKITYKTVENQVKKEIQKRLKNNNIQVSIKTRFKSIYSIHKKIINRNILFSQVLDIIGLRIITKKDSASECYKVMEYLLNTWPIINNKIKDYISVPKNNGYQSIHLTIMFGDHPVELQIRTAKMHENAMFGSAAHSIYKAKMFS